MIIDYNVCFGLNYSLVLVMRVLVFGYLIMTAEIAIMNKSAIALAADSAVTLEMERGHKIYTTNKLFTLSKYHPVGIMIYGKAELMDIPWETIIKTYRKKMGHNKFASISEYQNSFLDFLEKESILFPQSSQKQYFKDGISLYFSDILDEIKENIKDFTQKKKISKFEITKIVDNVINNRIKKLSDIKRLQNFSIRDVNRIKTKYSDVIESVISDIFKKIPLATATKNCLKKIASILFSHMIFQKSISGIIIAGFGEQDIFPGVRSFEIEGVINDKVKYKTMKGADINQDNPSCIIPFAQGEMVASFMEGVDPYYRKCLFDGLKEILVEKYPNYVKTEITNLSKTRQNEISKNLSSIGKGILDEFQNQLNNYSEIIHVAPVTRAVSFLPKEELAIMAETLVNLTSFKKKVSVDAAETVGGPIDVAVISKGDGFVWIKRKHYFEQKLNPCFITNYFNDK